MNLFFHFFVSNILVSIILVVIFYAFSSTIYLGGIWGMGFMATLFAFLFSSLVPSWFSISQYGFLYWFIYYCIPALGATLGILFLRIFSLSRNDL